MKDKAGERVDFDLQEDRLFDVAAACDSVGLSGESKVVVAGDIAFLAKAKGVKYLKGDDPDSFYAYLSDPLPDTDLFLYGVMEEFPRSGKLYEALSKGKAKISAVPVLDRNEWLDYIGRYFPKRGKDIETAAAKALYDRTGGDYAAFLNEAAKLIAYSGEEKTITKKDVELLVSEPEDQDAFQLYEAIIKGKADKAYTVYSNLSKKAGQEVSLIHLLGTQFRFTLSCVGLAERGLSSSAISSTLKASPYRVQITLRNAGRFDKASLSKMLYRLFEADYAIFSGRLKAEDAFFNFLKEALS